MEYRIVNFPYGKWQVQRKYQEKPSFLDRLRGIKYVEQWETLDKNGRPPVDIPRFNHLFFFEPKLFSTPQEAEVFIKWLQSDKVWRPEAVDRADHLPTLADDIKYRDAHVTVTTDNVEEVLSDAVNTLKAGQDELIDKSVDAIQEVVSPKRMGRRLKYDRGQMEQDFRDGYTTAEVAERHEVSYPTAAKVKKEMKGLSTADEAEPKRTGRPTTKVIEPKPVGPDTNLDAEIKLLFVQGFKLEEVQAMYPMVPMVDLVKLKSAARA